jgi:hypothetical protein
MENSEPKRRATSFRSREALFIPPARWQTTRRAHYRRLHLPQDPPSSPFSFMVERLARRGTAGGGIALSSKRSW